MAKYDFSGERILRPFSPGTETSDTLFEAPRRQYDFSDVRFHVPVGISLSTS